MRTFKPYDLDQPYLLPPDLRSWLSEGHLALFVSDVVDALDLSTVLDTYERGDGRGYPPYHPVMMVKLLVYGYCTGKTSSRKIEKATWDDVAYRVLSGNQQPDHDSIADFRRRHLKALAGLFVQVLKLCQEAGLVKLGHVSVDGSKVKVSPESGVWSVQPTPDSRLRTPDFLSGDELPEELKRRESRLKKIREAKSALEAQAKVKAEAEAQEARDRIAERERQEEETGKKIGGVPPRIPDPEQAVPSPKAQRNFTDPDSRIMLDGATKSFQQSFNAQIAVDSTCQIIVAAAVTQDAVDYGQLVPLLVSVETNFGQFPAVATADNGYFSEAAITDERLAGIDLHVATGRERKTASRTVMLDPTEGPVSTLQPLGKAPPRSVIQQMREKLATDTGRATYKLRKSIVEPVFGQIKQARGFRQFSFRGLANVAAEWDLASP